MFSQLQLHGACAVFILNESYDANYYEAIWMHDLAMHACMQIL